jgi:hypothetical protein
MPVVADELGNDLTRKTENTTISGICDAILFVAVLGFSAIALLALALAAPLALAISAVSGAASALFAGSGRSGGWRTANPA